MKRRKPLLYYLTQHRVSAAIILLIMLVASILGIVSYFENREGRIPEGLYQNGIRVGTVAGFQVDDTEKTFKISSVEYEKPVQNLQEIWRPYEYQDYIIQFTEINTLITNFPAGAHGIKGNIIS